MRNRQRQCFFTNTTHIADLTGDGLNDIVSCALDKTTILPQLGDGSLGPPVVLSRRVGDINGDGLNDIFFEEADHRLVSLFLL